MTFLTVKITAPSDKGAIGSFFFCICFFPLYFLTGYLGQAFLQCPWCVVNQIIFLPNISLEPGGKSSCITFFKQQFCLLFHSFILLLLLRFPELGIQRPLTPPLKELCMQSIEPIPTKALDFINNYNSAMFIKLKEITYKEYKGSLRSLSKQRVLF